MSGQFRTLAMFFLFLYSNLLQADVFLVLWFKDNATKPMYRWEFSKIKWSEPTVYLSWYVNFQSEIIMHFTATPFVQLSPNFGAPPFYPPAPGYHSFEVPSIIHPHFTTPKPFLGGKNWAGVKFWRFKKFEQVAARPHICQRWGMWSAAL